MSKIQEAAQLLRRQADRLETIIKQVRHEADQLEKFEQEEGGPTPERVFSWGVHALEGVLLNLSVRELANMQARLAAQG